MNKKMLLCSALVFLTAACSGGKGGKGSGANDLDQNVPVPGFQGEFANAKEDPRALTAVNNCSNPSQVGWDARLQPGQEFTFTDKWSVVGGGFAGEGDVRMEIQSVDRSTHTVVRKSHLTGPGGQTGWIRTKCVASNRGYNISCDMIEASSNLANLARNSRGSDIRMKNCWLKWDGQTKTEEKVETGDYVFKKVGRKVSAVRLTQNQTGNLECDGSAAGKGTVETVRIYSAAVPTFKTTSCGSAGQIYEYSVVKSDKGAILSVKKFEVIDGRF